MTKNFQSLPIGFSQRRKDVEALQLGSNNDQKFFHLSGATLLIAKNCKTYLVIMVTFEKWLVREYPQVMPKGRIRKAIKYTYHIYNRHSRYHLDGRYRIDNNMAENSIRPLALGRKNYLFCGNHDAAEDAAIIYSLLGTCKGLNVNFRDWLIYLLSHTHDFDNDYSKDLAELLPNNWAEKLS